MAENYNVLYAVNPDRLEGVGLYFNVVFATSIPINITASHYKVLQNRNSKKS